MSQRRILISDSGQRPINADTESVVSITRNAAYKRRITLSTYYPMLPNRMCVAIARRIDERAC